MQLEDMAPELIAIDLDGTLIDSAPDIHASVNDMQRTLGNPERSAAQVKQWIGNGLSKLVQRALAGSLQGTAEHPQFAEAMAQFEQAYQYNNGRYSRLYEGVEASLEALASICPLACITNKSERFTLPLLRQFRLDHYFQQIVSGDSLPHKKPHPEPLLSVAKKIKANPMACVMIGDSMNDLQAAHAAGFKMIGVSYGYNQGQSLTANKSGIKADIVVDSFADIAELLDVSVYELS